MAIFSHSASRDWNSLGNENPYYGVISSGELLSGSITDDAKRRFFQSGERHVAQLRDKIEDLFGAMPTGVALDFGCGVGRVARALAPLFDRVVGLDISKGMLAEAEKNARLFDIPNISYGMASSKNAMRPNSYDLVHSYIVLQHIPVKDGEAIFANLIRSIKPGGVGAIHITIRPAKASLRLAIRNLVKRSKILRPIGNIYSGRPIGSATMEMNAYRLERLLDIMHDNGIDQYTSVRVDDWGSLGVFLFMKRELDAKTVSPWSNPRPV